MPRVKLKEIKSTGWESHIDTTYTEASPLLLLAGVDTVLDINSDVSILTHAPQNINLYDTTNKIIPGREGDGISFDVFVKAKSNTNNATVWFWLDIGGTVGTIYQQNNSIVTGANIEDRLRFSATSAYTLDTWEANGATLYLKSDEDVEIYNPIINIARTHKA